MNSEMRGDSALSLDDSVDGIHSILCNLHGAGQFERKFFAHHTNSVSPSNKKIRISVCDYLLPSSVDSWLKP